MGSVREQQVIVWTVETLTFGCRHPSLLSIYIRAVSVYLSGCSEAVRTVRCPFVCHMSLCPQKCLYSEMSVCPYVPRNVRTVRCPYVPMSPGLLLLGTYRHLSVRTTSRGHRGHTDISLYERLPEGDKEHTDISVYNWLLGAIQTSQCTRGDYVSP